MFSTGFFRVSLGVALILTIPELALLAVFTRHTISQGSIYAFEIVGLATSSFTLLVLPVLILGPLFSSWSTSPISLPIFEIPMLAILSGLWLAFTALELRQGYKWYPIPKAYRGREDVTGCQFLPEGREVHWCNLLSSTSTLMLLILVVIVGYTLLRFGTVIFQLGDIRVCTRKLVDAVLHRNIPARRPQQPLVLTPRSQPLIYKLQLFGGRWKKGERAGIPSETASVQDGSDYISLHIPDGHSPPCP